MQADLRLCWSPMPHCWKSHIAAHLSLKTNPAKMMQKLNDVKKEYSTLVEEAASIQKAQQVLLIYGPDARKSVFGGF